MKITCIIPAYNEGPRIKNVLEVISSHPLIDEVLVIDDGSSDNSKGIARGFNKVTTLVHKHNQGKSAALYTGIKAASGDLLVLIDADLIGLSSKDIDQLLQPVISGYADTSLSLRQNAPSLWKIIGLDYISGERVFVKKIIEKDMEKIKNLPRFGFEVFLNDLFIKNHSRIAVVSWNNVQSPFKYKKFGIYQGIKGELIMVWDILKTISFWQIIKQIKTMRALRVVNIASKFSLIIPAYNEEKEIGECLNSVIKNAKGLFQEIIVVDNASTDRTAQIASSFQGVRVVYEGRKGLTRARQRGLEESKGNILAFIDADTRIPSNWAPQVITAFQNSNLACLSGPHFYYNLSPYQQFLIRIYWYILAWPVYLIVGYMVIGVNFVIRRSVLEKMNGFDQNINFYGEDTDIARRASRFGKVKFSLNFFMPTSGRRLAKDGLLKSFWMYGLNFLSEVLWKKPLHQNYIDIR